MKGIKKIVTLCSALLLTLGLAGITACVSPETSDPISSAPETQESNSAEQPETPIEKDLVQYEEVGYYTQMVLPTTFTTFSHQLDAGIYYVTSYGDATVFNEDYSEGVYAELTENGTLEFDVFYNDWDIPADEEIEIDYYVYKIIPLQLSEQETSAKFLADGAITPVTLTISEAGVYRVNVSQDVSFFSAMDELSYLVYQNYYVLVADQANSEFTLYIGGLESAYGDVELTFALETVTPVAVTTETEKLTLSAANDNAYAFTAQENGAYRIEYDLDNELSIATFDAQTNAIPYEYDCNYLEFDYTGAPVVFFAKYAYPDEFVSPYQSGITITRIGDVGYRSPVSPEDITLTPEFPASSFVPANSVEQNIPLTVSVTAIGEWSISWDNDNVKVYLGENLIEKDYKFSVEERCSVDFTVHNDTDKIQNVTFALTDLNAGASDAMILTLGANEVAVTVTNFYPDQTQCIFTAEKTGKYRISVAANETNADVTVNDEWVEAFPYEFTLNANESVSILVASVDIMSITEDVIDLVIEYFDEATQTWVQQ